MSPRFTGGVLELRRHQCEFSTKVGESGAVLEDAVLIRTERKDPTLKCAVCTENLPAVLGEHVREERLLLDALRPASQAVRHAEPAPVLRERDVRRLRLQVQQRHDHVAQTKRLPVVTEAAVRRELAGSAESVRVLVLTWNIADET